MRLIQNAVLKIAAFAFCALLFSFTVSAQSTDANFPTAVSSNEIEGMIKARDVGDSRVTSYFYTFDGGQGDVFINVVTKNFTGDIDVFAAEGLRPLTKMVVYAEASESETGRIVYLRKAERLILRVEARSPNDDPATFRIKFAGSFVALAPQKPQDIPTIKTSEVIAESGVRVNSVGTIVEVLPKAPLPAEERRVATETVATAKEKEKKTKAPAKKPVVIVTEPPATTVSSEKKPPPKKPVKTPPAKKPVPASRTPKKPEGPEVNTVFKKSSKPKSAAAEKPPPKPAKPTQPAAERPPDPMASIRLVVQLKDGNVIERPMNEVQKFSVDKGVLTVVAKDGSTVKYSILDVAKVTIE